MANSGRASWSDITDVKLRKPNNYTSNLSPNAKEFVPSSKSDVDGLSTSYSNLVMSSVQDRLKVHHVHDPQNKPLQSHSAEFCDTSQEQYSQPTPDEYDALNYTVQLLNEINEDPGQFDFLQEYVLQIFKRFETNKYVLSNAIELIFDKSIDDQNFRYMGAKLYKLLDSMVPSKNSVFKNLLMLKLKYHQEQIREYMVKEHHKVRGTALFLAELFMQLQNDGVGITEIAHNVTNTIFQLLSNPNSENVKCICLALKLAGYELEKDCRDDIYKIIFDLEKLKLDEQTGRILQNVLALKKNNWGRTESIPNSIPMNNDIMPAQFSDDPVCYGPDGHVITEEESLFLESNLPSYDEYNDLDLELDPNMDAEMQMEYHNFVNTIELRHK